MIYIGAVILELNSSRLEDKLLFRYVENTSLIMIVPMMVLCTLDFLGRRRWLRPGPRYALLAVFAAWVLLVWIDPYTGWINLSVVIINGQLTVAKSSFAILLNLIAYGILALCAFFFILYLRRARPAIRRAGMWLIAFGSLAFLTEIIKVSNPGMSAWLLPASAYSGFCAMAMLLIIISNRLFSIVPLARDIVIGSMEGGVLIVNETGKVVDSNSYMNRLLSPYAGGKAIGRSVRELLAGWPEWLEACLESRHDNLEIGSVAVDGERAYLVKVYPLSAADRIGTVSLLVDITDKQRRLEQIIRLNGVKDRLLTAVSHDIRDPLAIQVNLIEELEVQYKTMDAGSRELVAALGGQIRSSFVMVENLLEWFRGQSEGMALRSERLDLRELAEEACEAMQIKSKDKDVQLRNAIPEDFRVLADRESTLLILRNLLANAIKFSYRGGRVEMSAEAEDDQVVVAVRDEGVGMDEQQVNELFDVSRLKSSIGTEGEKGAGLGLVVCHQFALLGGGRMWAESKPDIGSIFYFTLTKS